MPDRIDQLRDALADRYRLERELGQGAWPRGISPGISGPIAKVAIQARARPFTAGRELDAWAHVTY